MFKRDAERAGYRYRFETRRGDGGRMGTVSSSREKRLMSAEATRPPSDRNFVETSRDLRVSKTTLDNWLTRDLLRAVDDRRFQFHSRRGRKRIWSPTAFEQLRDAIERESQ